MKIALVGRFWLRMIWFHSKCINSQLYSHSNEQIFKSSSNANHLDIPRVLYTGYVAAILVRNDGGTKEDHLPTYIDFWFIQLPYPRLKMVGFCDVFRVGIAPLIKKLTVELWISYTSVCLNSIYPSKELKTGRLKRSQFSI